MEPALCVRAIGQAMAASEELRAFRLPDLRVVHHSLELLLVDARTHVNPRVEAIPDFQLLGARDKVRGKVVIDRLVHRDAAGRSAALACSSESAPDGTVHREIEVGVFHNDDDVLAAPLQAAMLEFGRARFSDETSYGGRAG